MTFKAYKYQKKKPRIFSYYDNHIAIFFTVSGEVRPGKLVAIMGAR